MNPCASAAETGLEVVMVISGKCLLAAPLLSCPCGGVGLPPPLFLALEAAAAIAEEVRAGPSFRGRGGRPFLLLFPIITPQSSVESGH